MPFVPDVEDQVTSGFVPDAELSSGFVPDAAPGGFVPDAPEEPEVPVQPSGLGGGGGFLRAVTPELEPPLEPMRGVHVEEPWEKVARPLAELYVKEGATAIKFQQLKAWDMSEQEALQKAEKWDWPKMFLWKWGHDPDDPEFKSPESAYWNTLGTQLVGEVSSGITKPSTWATWAVAQAAFPEIAAAVAGKFPKLAAALQTPVGKLASRDAGKAISEIQASQAASRIAEGGINLKGVLKGQTPAMQKKTLELVAKQMVAAKQVAEPSVGVLMRRALEATGRFSASQIDELTAQAIARRMSPQSFQIFLGQAMKQGQAPMAKEIASNLVKPGKITQKAVMQLRMFTQTFPEEAAGLIGAEMAKLVPEAKVPEAFVPDEVVAPAEVPPAEVPVEVEVPTGFVPDEPVVAEAPEGFVPREGVVAAGLGEKGEAISPAFAAHEIGKGATETMRSIIEPIKKELEPTSYTPENYTETFRKLIGERNVGYERVDTLGQKIRDFVGNDTELDRAILLYQQYGDAPEYVARTMGQLPEGVLKTALDRMLRLTPAEKEFAEGIRAHFAEVGGYAQEAGVLEELRPGYAPGYWRPKAALGKAVEWGKDKIRTWQTGKLRTTTPHAKAKIYEGYIEGVLAGETPVTLRASDIVPKYSRDMLTVVTARSFVDSLKKMVMEDGRRAVEYEFRPGHEDYSAISHPALRKHKYMTTDAEGKPIFQRVPLVAHPDIAKALTHFLARSAFDDSAVLGFVKKINLMQKLGKVRLGFFHWNALSRQALQFGVSPASARRGLKQIMSQDPIVEELVRQGMTLGGGEMADYAESFYRSMEDTALETAETLPGGARKAIKAAIKKWDKALWHDFFRGLKAYTGKIEFERNLDRYPNKTRTEVARITGEDMNRVYGGLNYELMGRSRTMQDVLRMLMFAPDWTESNWRGWGRALNWGKGAGMRRMIVRGLLFFGMAHITMNKVLSGKYPWENEKGHKWDVDLGIKNPTGQEMYWNIYGHTIEPIKAMRDPGRWAKGKLGLFAREAMVQIEGKDWRDRPFAQIEDLMDGYLTGVTKPRGFIEQVETIPARGIHAARSFVPIPMDAMLMWMTGQEDFPAIIDDILGERMSKGVKGGELATEIRDVRQDTLVLQARAKRKARDHLRAGEYEDAFNALIRGNYADPKRTLLDMMMFEEATLLRAAQGMTKREKLEFVKRKAAESGTP